MKITVGVGCGILFAFMGGVGRAQTAAGVQTPASNEPSTGSCSTVIEPMGWTISTPLPGAPLGAPYSGVSELTIVQTLADGTRATQEQPRIKTYRDSQGRTRKERPMCWLNNPNVGLLVEILDPVAGYQYDLDVRNKIAYRYTLQGANTGDRVMAMVRAAEQTHRGNSGGVMFGAVKGGGVGASVSGPIDSVAAPNANGGGVMDDASNGPDRLNLRPKPQTTTESLGSRTIEGVYAEGTKVTTVYPVGFRFNDRASTAVEETWYSPDLRKVVLQISSDSRSGESTSRLTDIDLSNPGIELFQPPAGYQVIDETDAVTISVSIPRP